LFRGELIGVVYRDQISQEAAGTTTVYRGKLAIDADKLLLLRVFTGERKFHKVGFPVNLQDGRP
jgi:hypothetical protein